MTISVIIIIISLILEIILSNFLPYLVGNLSLFTPMFTIVSLFLIYPFFKKEQKKYFILVFVLGMIYDLIFTNLLFFNGIIFIIIAYLITKLYKYFETNFINIIIGIIITIASYEIITGLIIILFNLVPMSFTRLIYKISHSLILNIIYGELIFIIIKHLPKKYTKLSIN